MKQPTALQRIRSSEIRRRLTALLGNWPGEAGGLPAQVTRLQQVDDFIYDLPAGSRDKQACRDASAGLRQHVSESLAREREVAKLAAAAKLPPVPLTVGALRALLAGYSDNTLVHLLPHELAAQSARALAMLPPMRRVAAHTSKVSDRPTAFGLYGVKTAKDLGL